MGKLQELSDECFKPYQERLAILGTYFLASAGVSATGAAYRCGTKEAF